MKKLNLIIIKKIYYNQNNYKIYQDLLIFKLIQILYRQEFLHF